MLVGPEVPWKVVIRVPASWVPLKVIEVPLPVSIESRTLALFTEVHSWSNQMCEVTLPPSVIVTLVAVPAGKNQTNCLVVLGDTPSENRGVPLAVRVPEPVLLTHT